MPANETGPIRTIADRLSGFVNRIVEGLLVVLTGALVVDVWIGVIDRYIFHWQFPWPEILARYLMIWMALLAISSAIVHREHIGLAMLLDRLPERLRASLLILSDILVLGLFLYLFWYGLGFAASGLKRNAMIFGLSLTPAFAAVPAAAGLAALQTALVLIRDFGSQRLADDAREV